MAHYDLEEQEQIDTLKTWWKMYGNLVTGLVMAASLAVVGWQGWNWYQGGQSAKAAAIYGVLEQAAAVVVTGLAGQPGVDQQLDGPENGRLADARVEAPGGFDDRLDADVGFQAEESVEHGLPRSGHFEAAIP